MLRVISHQHAILAMLGSCTGNRAGPK